MGSLALTNRPHLSCYCGRHFFSTLLPATRRKEISHSIRAPCKAANILSTKLHSSRREGSSCSSPQSSVNPPPPADSTPQNRYAAGLLEVHRTVGRLTGSRARLDSYLNSELPDASRAKIQAAIRAGLVEVNGRPQTKASSIVRPGDVLRCKLPHPPPSEAIPEQLPLDIVYEDTHLIVINKPSHMVVHPSAGHQSGTLVNALLFHCGLPAMRLSSGSTHRQVSGGLLDSRQDSSLCADCAGQAGDWEDSGELADGADEVDDEDEDDADVALLPRLAATSSVTPVLRPGIVHRLDKGTSGLMVVAKDERAHNGLCDQFKARSVGRTYVSVTVGVPPSAEGRVEAAVGRDTRDRKRMAVIPGGSSARSRHAASRYRVVEVLAAGGAALVEWKLETGRTHQIRVHAKHVGRPLMGDDTYGGGSAASAASLVARLPVEHHGLAKKLAAGLERPTLHARTLGFLHPWTKENLFFEVEAPEDFLQIVATLRSLNPPPDSRYR